MAQHTTVRPLNLIPLEAFMETVCPYCDQFLEVPDEIEGTRTRCQFCNEIFTVDPLFILDTNEVGENAFAP